MIAILDNEKNALDVKHSRFRECSSVITIDFKKGFAWCKFYYGVTEQADRDYLKRNGVDGVYGKITNNGTGVCKLTLEKETLFLLQLRMPADGVLFLDE